MKKKILIVDDELGVRHILSSSIKKLNFEVVEAVDGLDAIEKIKAESPDLVLLDLFMPSKDGFSVLEEFKVKQQSSIPFIVLSNLDEQKDVERGRKLGATDYIVKSSLTLKEIMMKIQDSLEKQGGPAA